MQFYYVKIWQLKDFKNQNSFISFYCLHFFFIEQMTLWVMVFGEDWNYFNLIFYNCLIVYVWKITPPLQIPPLPVLKFTLIVIKYIHSMCNRHLCLVLEHFHHSKHNPIFIKQLLPITHLF